MDGPTSTRTRVRRHPERALYDRAAVHSILDEAIFCHVAFEHDGHPFSIPTVHARVGEDLYLHGSPASRMMRHLSGGVDVCVTATLLDGIVVARAAKYHSLNYRSAVVLGRTRRVEEREEKLSALAAIVEHIVPGRLADARPPDDKELSSTSVVALAITEASAKARFGPPRDPDPDVDLPIWAGVIPVRLVAGSPETESRVPPGIAAPPYATSYRRPMQPIGGWGGVEAVAERPSAGSRRPRSWVRPPWSDRNGTWP